MKTPLLVLALVVACGAACPPRAPDSTVAATKPPPSPSTSVFAPQPAGKRVAVLYTASVQGYVEPCGCTGDPLGGVARLAAAVDDAKKAWGGRVLFVDGGDLLFEKRDDTSPADACQAAARADLLVSTYARLGLAGTVLGPLDDVRGPSFRDARLARAKVPTLGVTQARPLVDGASAETGLVKDLEGTKVGVTAFRVDGPADLVGAHEKLAAEVARMKGAGAEAVVVFAQAPREITKKVVTNVPGLDVVVQARSPGETPVAPETLDGGVILVASGQQAQHLGVLELVLDGRAPGQPLELDDRKAQSERREKVLKVRIEELRKQLAEAPEGPKKQFLQERLTAADAELLATRNTDVTKPLAVPHVVARAVALPRGFPEEAKAKADLESYTKSIPALVASCEADMECPAPPPGAKTFVGAATCKTCHAEEHAFWTQQLVELPFKDPSGKPITRKVGHAHAWETLVNDGKDKDRSCVGCHSVGFGVPGGACKTADIVARGLEGVQCESCHGPGSAHAQSAAKADIVRAPAETTCRACHRVPHIPTTESFVFGDRLKLVTGPGHGG